MKAIAHTHSSSRELLDLNIPFKAYLLEGGGGANWKKDIFANSVLGHYHFFALIIERRSYYIGFLLPFLVSTKPHP